MERYSEPRPVPPIPQRFDEPSTTAGDVDPDWELQPIAAQGDEVDSEQNAGDPPMDDAVVAESAEAVAGAEADSEQNADPPMEEAAIAESAEAEPDRETVLEQNAEDPPMDDAVVAEWAEAVPGAEADSEQNAEHPPMEEAVIAESAEAEPDRETVSEQNAEDPPMDDAVAAERAEAAPDDEVGPELNGEVVEDAAAVHHSETGEELNAAARGDGIVGAPAVETETARDTVAALAAPAPTPPAAPHDEGLGKLIGQMIVTGFDGTTPEDGGVQRLIALLESGKARSGAGRRGRAGTEWRGRGGRCGGAAFRDGGGVECRRAGRWDRRGTGGRNRNRARHGCRACRAGADPAGCPT
jgi:hypothetical protein